MSEIDGAVKFGGITRGKRKLIITGEDGSEHEYEIPRGTHINVQEGDRVKAGEPLMDGPLESARHSESSRNGCSARVSRQ